MGQESRQEARETSLLRIQRVTLLCAGTRKQGQDSAEVPAVSSCSVDSLHRRLFLPSVNPATEAKGSGQPVYFLLH